MNSAWCDGAMERQSDLPKELGAQLCAAVKSGNHAAVERLLEGGDADTNAKDHAGHPALSIAVASGFTECAALLIVHHADVAAAGAHGATALHIASQKGDTVAVELLVQHKAPLNAQDENGATPICRAAFDGQLACVSLLMLAGADVGVQARGLTAQQLAEQKGHKAVVALLRDPVPVFRDQICTAAKSGNLGDVSRLLDSGFVDANAKDRVKGRPVLCWATLNGHVQIAKLLLDRGADVGMRSEELGWTEVHGAGDHTALHFTASFARHPGYPTEEMVSLLLHHKAPTDVVNCQGATALFDSRLFNQPDTGILLVRAGADPTVQSPRSGLAPVILPLVITDTQKTAKVGETKATAAAIDAAIAECTLDNVLAWWPEHLRAYATQMLATQARERGLRDDALLPGTRIKINAIGEGVYSGWDRKIGANTHYIRIDDEVHKVRLKKLKAPQWSVQRGLSDEQVARDLEIEAAYELEKEKEKERERETEHQTVEQRLEKATAARQPDSTTMEPEMEPATVSPMDPLGCMPATKAPKPSSITADSFNVELATLTVGRLKKRAKALGATVEQIEEVDEADDVKAAAVALVLSQRGALYDMKVGGLKRSLRSSGASESQIESLDDHDDPKEAAIQLILEVAAEVSVQTTADPQQAIMAAAADPTSAVAPVPTVSVSEGHGSGDTARVSDKVAEDFEARKRQLFGSMRFKNGGILPEAKVLQAELAKHDAPMHIIDM